MPSPAQHTLPARLLGLIAIGLALTLAGCAVPVADGYGYDTYDGYYAPGYPPATYVTPASPPVVYGAPPVMFGGQIWIDSPRRPERWREPPRRHEGWRNAPTPRPSWRHDGDHRPGQRPGARPPDASTRPSHPPQARPRFPEGGEPHRNRGPRSDNGRDFP